jgi:predicted SAM-dependent methyltransferase
MEFYSTTKKNEIFSFRGKWIELEIITLGEVSQVQKAKSHMFFSHLWNIDLIIEQHYEKQLTLREVTHETGRVKEES